MFSGATSSKASIERVHAVFNRCLNQQLCLAAADAMGVIMFCGTLGKVAIASDWVKRSFYTPKITHWMTLKKLPIQTKR